MRARQIISGVTIMASAAPVKQSGMAAAAAQDLSRELCANVVAWRYESLPEGVVRTVKALVLDTLGVIAGARSAPGIPELNRRLARWEHSGSATGLVDKARYSPPTAAMANGAAAHALDFDDQH